MYNESASSTFKSVLSLSMLIKGSKIPQFLSDCMAITAAKWTTIVDNFVVVCISHGENIFLNEGRSHSPPRMASRN